MEKIELLIENIKKCNLSLEDKKILLEKLENENPDIDGFLQTFLLVCKVGKEVLKYFDFDIGDLLN